MALPDPADHAPACPAHQSGKAPALEIRFDAAVDASTVQVYIWEWCTGCNTATHYTLERIPWRTFNRTWRARCQVWISTWEHRHQLGDRVTRT